MESTEGDAPALGWQPLGHRRVACVLRKGVPYCAARALGASVRFAVRPEVFSCTAVVASRATAAEAHLFDQVDQPDGDLDPDGFAVGEPLMKLEDARGLLQFLRKCHARLSGRPGPCGLFRLASERVVPYVAIDQIKYVPLHSLPVSDRLKMLNIRAADCWSVAYLKFCSKVAGEERSRPPGECAVAAIDDVKNCLGLEYEEYWPDVPFLTSSKDTEKDCKDIQLIKIKSEDSTSNDGHSNILNSAPCDSTSHLPSGFNVRLVMSNSEKDNVEGMETDDQHTAKKSQIARETEEERAKRLQRLRAKQAERIASETPEQRESRLAKLRLYQSRRLARETDEQRQKRLLQLRLNQAKRVARRKNEKLLKLNQNISMNTTSQQPPEHINIPAPPAIQHPNSAFDQMHYHSNLVHHPHQYHSPPPHPMAHPSHYASNTQYGMTQQPHSDSQY